MKNGSHSNQRKALGWLGLIVGLTLSFYVVLPHQAKILKNTAKLPSGQTVRVEIQLQSPWSWLAPTHLVDLKVWINDEPIPIASQALNYPVAFNPLQVPLVASRQGFPLIRLYPVEPSQIRSVEWYFLNNVLSERLVSERDQINQVSYPGPIPVLKQVSLIAAGQNSKNNLPK